ncbi:MAG: response regulator [Planctomycetota bacterium]|nr:response regulator [Planctomycetota bacterium]
MPRKVWPVLLVEDSPSDALLIAEFLNSCGERPIDLARAERLADGLALAGRRAFDVVLLDLSLPDNSGLDGLRRMREAAKNAPVVILTGSADPVAAEDALKAGAQDYLVKGQFDREMLFRSLRYACERQRIQNELAERNRQLEEALANVKELNAMLPICSWCHKIRDDGNFWRKMEEYIASRTKSTFTHSICPECREKLRRQKRQDAG